MSVTKLVVAQDDQQCTEHRFDTPFFPGSSCEDIYNKNLQSRNMPGYYWILDGPLRVYCGMNYTGSSCEDIYNNFAAVHNKSGYYRINNNEWVYCNMTGVISSCAGVGGVWRRIASFNITAGDNCPSPWVKNTYNGVSYCIASTNAGCYSVSYSTNGASYQRVCGRARAYQKGSPDGFLDNNNIDSNYFDGLSITHGSPRQHIWTYAVGLTYSARCPCSGGRNPPNFVGTHYYCESGTSNFDVSVYYLSDALWDGAGCPPGNACCSAGPWFYRQLSETSHDDIEVRSCMDQSFGDEAVLITNLEVYRVAAGNMRHLSSM